MLALTAAAPLMAQDAAANKPKQISIFTQFFWADDVFGIIQIWALILMSIVVVALVIKHAMANKIEQFTPKEAVDEYEQMLTEKKFREAIEKAGTDTTMFGKLLHSALSEAANGFGAMERAIEETADYEANKRIRAMEWLNVLGATGPMVGLFGTVYGMIVAFYVIVAKGGQPDPAALAGGVATALVTTLWGLIVGIPAVAALALLKAKVDGQTVETMIQVEALIGQFAPGKKPAAAPAKPAAAPAPAPAPAPKPA
jgi:biopolymer transport protein ExbB